MLSEYSRERGRHPTFYALSAPRNGALIAPLSPTIVTLVSRLVILTVASITTFCYISKASFARCIHQVTSLLHGELNIIHLPSLPLVPTSLHAPTVYIHRSLPPLQMVLSDPLILPAFPHLQTISGRRTKLPSLSQLLDKSATSLE